ncbi:MAG: phage major capsid protein [Chloroflexi bacterium]|nr:phage major capsid protein [Chloroflexota bacterium]
MNPEIRAAFLAQIEARNALNGLDETATAETRQAAIDALAAADQDLKDAIEALPENIEQRERQPLADRVSLSRYMLGVLEQRAVDGAEAELRTELKLSDQAIPWEALAAPVEERADEVSPQNKGGDQLAYGTINITTAGILSRVFTRTDTGFLGVSLPGVAAGQRRFPVMIDGTAASMQARGGEPDAGAAKFDVVDATPHRLTGRYVLDIEGLAEMGQALEGQLRADLRTEMGYQMDRQILLGDGTGANVTGLIAQLDLTAMPGSEFATNDVPLLSWANFKEGITATLDGKYGRTEMDERWLLGHASYTLARTLYRGNNNSGNDWDAIEMSRNLGARSAVSFQIPAPAVATIKPKTAKSSKKVQSAIVNMEPGAAVAPVWQGLTMIRDPYTEAGKGQVIMTAHMMFDFIMRRTDGWKRYAIRTES